MFKILLIGNIIYFVLYCDDKTMIVVGGANLYLVGMTKLD